MVLALAWVSGTTTYRYLCCEAEYHESVPRTPGVAFATYMPRPIILCEQAPAHAGQLRKEEKHGQGHTLFG